VSTVLFSGGGTGGHLYPALALAEAMSAERPDVQVHFVGAKRGVEARVLPQRGLPHTLLPFEPFRRERVWQNWRLLPSVTRSMTGLSRIFLKLRPVLVVGTGGYASAPAGFFAVLAGVPVAVQEQNSWPGLTTRLLARWARQVHLGFPEAERHLKPGRNTRVLALGNPIHPPRMTQTRAESRARYGLDPNATVVLVVGGSQGSRALNEALASALEMMAQGVLPAPSANMQILWSTGPNNFDEVNGRIQPLRIETWVKTRGYIDEMPHALASADIALSRAGAMGTAELLAWGIPAILVPLPTAAADHQTHNARVLADAGAAIFLPEAEATPERLWTELTGLVADRAALEAMMVAARGRAHPSAARDIARHLLELVP
jgi:UDP-N-acetylglucosamine--N-acetylmuramyl-(pentapeptide) pyrophosphoryl-undecaprenol N-acetylglucosamine transferase